MGFCLFDNAAIAARYAQKQHGIARAAIVDFDVHHGNGSQEIFWADKTGDVLLDPPDAALSRHRRRRRVAASTTPSSTRRCAPATAARHSAQPSRAASCRGLRDFRPELIIISAGFDAHMRDPLANLNLREDDFAWATQKLMDVADRLREAASCRCSKAATISKALAQFGRRARHRADARLDARI